MSDDGQGPITVFLLDDHEIVRRGVADVLESDPGISVIGEGKNAAEALARVPALRPDVAVLDVRLPDGEGVSVCRDRPRGSGAHHVAAGDDAHQPRAVHDRHAAQPSARMIATTSTTSARARTLGAGDVITPPTVAAGCRVAGGAMPPSSEQ